MCAQVWMDVHFNILSVCVCTLWTCTCECECECECEPCFPKAQAGRPPGKVYGAFWPREKPEATGTEIRRGSDEGRA